LRSVFPSAASIQVLLREYRRTGDENLLHAATHSLDRMAYGDIYDQLGGLFAKNFEKYADGCSEDVRAAGPNV